MHVTALAGGVGGARFLRGVLAHLHLHEPGSTLTVIGNTGDDLTMYGLRISPDLDTLIYTLGGAIDDQNGWGRADDSHVVQGELTAYGATPDWFSLGDRDLAAHIARSQWLGQGLSLSTVTARLADRFGLADRGIQILPMTDTPVETHVIVDTEDGQVALHFQDWWVRHHAELKASRFVVAGMDRATPAPGVIEAIKEADLVLLPPSNPVVSIGVILSVPGVREALRERHGPVVGVSPLISGAPVRGYADRCLAIIGVPATAGAVGSLYADFLSAWLVDPADAQATVEGVSVVAHSGPLLMSDPTMARELAAAAIALAS